MKGIRVALGLSLALHLVALMLLSRSKDTPEIRPPEQIIEVDVAGMAHATGGHTGSTVNTAISPSVRLHDTTPSHLSVPSPPQPQPVTATSLPVISPPHEMVVPAAVFPAAGTSALVPSSGGPAASSSQQIPSGGVISVPDGANARGAGVAADVYRGEIGGKNGPQFVSRRQPEYPAVARRRGLEGMVVLELHLDEQGELRSVRVIRSDHEAFTRSAEAAVRGSRFSAAKRNGRPASAVVTLPIRFNLGN